MDSSLHVNAPQMLDNPYAPPLEIGELSAPQSSGVEGAPQRSWLKSLAIWTAVCTVSAIPSFLWGLWSIAASEAAAMALGIALFIAGYTLADQATLGCQWRRQPSLRLALKIGYVTRLAVSVIFPVGGFLDMFCGVFSIASVEFLFSQQLFAEGQAGFGIVLITTLVQGVVLNVVLSAYMLVVWGILMITRRGVL